MESVKPLASYTVVDSNDMAAVEEQIARSFRHIRLRARGARPGPIRFSHAPLTGSRMSLGLLAARGPVTLATDDRPRFLPAILVLSGAAAVRCGGQAFEAHAGGAIFPGVDDDLRMDAGAGWSHLALRFDQQLVEHHLSALLGHPLDRALAFSRHDETGHGRCRSLQMLARSIVQELSDESSLLARGYTARECESLLITTLLHSQRHNYSSALLDPVDRCPPRYVRRAREYLDENLSSTVSIADLCLEIGVSARALHRGFKNHYGETPLEYLRNIRMDRARDELLHASPDQTVTDIAYRCGFTHLSRFSGDYFKRFGEKPSETLRR